MFVRFILLIAFFCILPIKAYANDSIHLGKWSTLPILYDGRVQPLDSFSNVLLKKIYGSKNVDGMDANQWLALTVFQPESAALLPVFKIVNPEKFGAQDIKKEYSYAEITNLLEKNKDNIDNLLKTNSNKWTADDKALVMLYENAIKYAELLRSLTGLLPLNIDSASQKNYFQLRDENSFPALKIIEAGGQNNNFFRIIPTDSVEKFISAWNALFSENINDTERLNLQKWGGIARAYRENDQETLNKYVAQLQESTLTPKLKTEYFYNQLSLLTVATILFFLSFVFIVAKQLINKPIFYKFSYRLLTIGLIANIVDIILRVYILSRPPVGTLYESIIFVSAVAILGFLFIEKRQKNETGILLGGIAGCIFLVTAKSFTSEDTMGTLVAVLNTNFWLLTHVICITIGYGICFLTAFIAHYYLFKKALKKQNRAEISWLYKTCITLSIISLLFTAVGTILGGIWADQSWGRFWGWDPKENGALLIVLWLIWILHNKISGHMNEIGFMIGAALLSIVVVIAWFGVNLLNVGLHSYGFITGVALGISLFCILEFLLVGALGTYIKRQSRNEI